MNVLTPVKEGDGDSGGSWRDLALNPQTDDRAEVFFAGDACFDARCTTNSA